MITKAITRLSVLGLIILQTNISQAQEGKPADTLAGETPKLKERPFQFTFITPVGTNGLEAPKITNRFSINWMGGLNGGVNGVEIGGFANVILNNVNGIQAAGFVNVVEQDVKGGQFAGFVNYSCGKLDGAQFAGFVNFNKAEARGGQLAGFVNGNLGAFTGAQLAGSVNYNQGNFKGLQGAGYVNVNIGNLKGAQLSGFVNVVKGDLNGGQAAGFINIARKVKGFQLGILNIADSVDGVSIGLLSIVKKGLHQVEIATDEVFYGNLSVRTGTHKFYNIYSIGLGSKPQGKLWQLGYGAGTSFGITQKLRSEISASAHHVSNGLLYFGTSELYKFYWGVEYKLANKVTISGGPTFNVYWGDALQPDFAKKYSGLAPYSVFNETNAHGFNFKSWFGARAAVRFL